MNANIHRIYKNCSNAKRLVLLVRSGFRYARVEGASENCLVVLFVWLLLELDKNCSNAKRLVLLVRSGFRYALVEGASEN